MSPPLVPSCCKGFVKALVDCRMSSRFVLSYCNGFVRALEACGMSPFFVLAGFGERLNNYQISFDSGHVLRGASGCPRVLSYVPPIS